MIILIIHVRVIQKLIIINVIWKWVVVILSSFELLGYAPTKMKHKYVSRSGFTIMNMMRDWLKMFLVRTKFFIYVYVEPLTPVSVDRIYVLWTRFISAWTLWKIEDKYLNSLNTFFINSTGVFLLKKILLMLELILFCQHVIIMYIELLSYWGYCKF